MSLFYDYEDEREEALRLYSNDRGESPDEVEGNFEDAYQGKWFSFKDFAENLCDSLGYLQDLPTIIKYNIDWDGIARELEYDYTTIEAEDGDVFVFRQV